MIIPLLVRWTTAPSGTLERGFLSEVFFAFTFISFFSLAWSNAQKSPSLPIGSLAGFCNSSNSKLVGLSSKLRSIPAGEEALTFLVFLGLFRESEGNLEFSCFVVNGVFVCFSLTD